MYYGHFPSEIAGNKLKFPAHKQQLLEPVIECGVLFDVVVGANGGAMIQKVIYLQFQNLKSLQSVIAIE